MKESEEDTREIFKLPLLTVAQAAEFGNINDVQRLVDVFASNARGVKALKVFHKRLLHDFMRYSQSANGDIFPGPALVFHKPKEQLTGLTPKQLQLEITNKENYSLWDITDPAHSMAKLTLRWGPRDLWEGVTVFQIDVTECEELVYILESEIDALIVEMETSHAACAASKTPTPPESELTTRAEAKKVSDLKAKLREAVELQASQNLALVRMGMKLHLAYGGTEDTFVSPVPGVPWSPEPSTSSHSGAQTPAGGSGVGSPKARKLRVSGIKPAVWVHQRVGKVCP